MRGERFAEVGEVVSLELEAGRHLVAAVGVEMIAAGVERAGKVEAGNGAAAPLAGPVGEGDHDRRAMESVDDARRDDADDAGVPAIGAEDDAVAAVIVEA